MRTVKLVIEYDGTNYHGWQRQANLPTIQKTLEDVLAQINKVPVKVTGASRTDAGVHAIGQVAHFKTSLEIGEKSWEKAINSLLPADIVVRKAEYVPPDFHARYSARGKVYRYIILNSHRISPFIRNYAWHIRHPLDILSMKEASNCLIGTHDFSSFRASECNARSPVRTLDRLEIRAIDSSPIFPIFCHEDPAPLRKGDTSPLHLPSIPMGEGRFSGEDSGSTPILLFLTFEARSFLQHMVRNIVGTLADVGLGRLEPSDVRDILDKKDRRYAGPIAPPRGLFLLEIKYP